MKNLFLIMLFALSLQAVAQGKFVINGTLPDNSQNGKTVYLQKTDRSVMDSCVVTGNTFRIKGIAPSLPQPALLSAPVIRDTINDNGTMRNVNSRPPMVILEAGTITVTSNGKVGGTPRNEEFQTFYNRFISLAEQYRKTQNPQLMNELKAGMYAYLKANISNGVGEDFFAPAVQLLEPKQLLELVKSARPEFQQKPEIQALAQELSTAQPSIGDKYIDVKLKNLDGKEACISDYTGKHKYVLLDFWASWCGPCIRENPTLLEAYGKYHAKGFEIIGLSLDEDHSRWSQAVKRLGITWPQLSDLGGWKSLSARTYKVNSIPASFLLNAEGVVIAKNLRGEELLVKLGELLGE